MTHILRYADDNLGLWRTPSAACSCGWSSIGLAAADVAAEVTAHYRVHDLGRRRVKAETVDRLARPLLAYAVDGPFADAHPREAAAAAVLGQALADIRTEAPSKILPAHLAAQAAETATAIHYIDRFASNRATELFIASRAFACAIGA